MTAQSRAHGLLVLVPAGLLVGAISFQHLVNLPPCEMCYWQRWSHLVALGAAIAAFLLPAWRQPLLWLAVAGVAVSGAIGIFHAGVEQGWWAGVASCATTEIGNGDFTAAMIDAPVVRCDAIPWSFAGVSMAGWNAALSMATAMVAGALLTRPARTRLA